MSAETVGRGPLLRPSEEPALFVCPNCSTESPGEFCAGCGQKRPHDGDMSLRHAWHHVVNETLDLDGRIFGTLKLLFTKPGQLSLDYIERRRARHVHPLRLFLIFSAVFFLVRSASVTQFLHGPSGKAEEVRNVLRQKAEREGVPYELELQRIDGWLAVVFKSAYTAAVVANGLWLALVFRRRGLYLAEHMVVALHLACFAMAIQVLLGPVSRWAFGGSNDPWSLSSGLGTLVGVYFAFAMRRVYRASWIPILAVALLAILSQTFIPGLALVLFALQLLR